MAKVASDDKKQKSIASIENRSPGFYDFRAKIPNPFC